MMVVSLRLALTMLMVTSVPDLALTSSLGLTSPPLMVMTSALATLVTMTPPPDLSLTSPPRFLATLLRMRFFTPSFSVMTRTLPQMMVVSFCPTLRMSSLGLSRMVVSLRPTLMMDGP